jgi:hypothetical protein
MMMVMIDDERRVLSRRRTTSIRPITAFVPRSGRDIQDKKVRPFVETYAKDNDAFFPDFSVVLVKLFEGRTVYVFGGFSL